MSQDPYEKRVALSLLDIVMTELGIYLGADASHTMVLKHQGDAERPGHREQFAAWIFERERPFILRDTFDGRAESVVITHVRSRHLGVDDLMTATFIRAYGEWRLLAACPGCSGRLVVSDVVADGAVSSRKPCPVCRVKWGVWRSDERWVLERRTHEPWQAESRQDAIRQAHEMTEFAKATDAPELTYEARELP